MPNRLVYSPQVYAFTKNAKGETLNISPYIVSGEVVRNINQVSTATLVLRNPDKIFTTPRDGTAFHPQDPITIYLERLAGYPVRVFTGYLDQTPYLQLQPAVIQLQASCTLKRLLYSFFDPSLPYMISFFEKYGWINTGQGSIISASALNAKNLKQTAINLENGSISRLLWGILYDIAQWDNTDIWIEPLPTGANGIVRRVLSLMNAIDTADAEAATQLEQVFNAMLGSSGQGSTGGLENTSLTGNDNAQKAFNFLVNNGFNTNAAAGVCGNWYYESGGIDPTKVQGGAESTTYSGAGGYGIAQWTPSTKLISWCQGQGLDYTKLDSQLQYALYSLPSSLISQLNAAGSPSQAAYTYLDQYEKDAYVVAGNINGDPSLPKRQQYAEQIYKQYASGVSGGTGNSTSPSTKKSNKSQKYIQSGKLSEIANSNASNSKNSLGQQIGTVYDAIVQGANAVASSGLPYPSPDAHFGSLAQTWSGGYDCSGSVSYVLYAAGLINADQAFDTEGEQAILTSIGAKPGIGPTGTGTVTIWVNPTLHTFMRIGGTQGRYWGTTDGTQVSGIGGTGGGAGAWLSNGTAKPANAADPAFLPYYLPASVLNKQATYRGPLPAGGTAIPKNGQAGTGGDGVTGLTSSTISQSSAEAFTQQLDFPTIEDSIAAILLGSEGKGLMHDQSLMPFVQQVTQASMREFMSLPDGSFYAFYPDYFGEMGQHEPYWMIDDIEITSGTINISDDALATHVYAVGDNTWPVDNALMNELFSAGTITVFNAFQTTGIIDSGTQANGLGAVMGTKEALDFIKRYGARPLVQEYPMVRSSIFEMLMAYQLFMKSWANQFLSTFNFTFMPELFPGGKVGFPSHGLMMYVNQVTHTFDYTAGFETTAQLSSPSIMSGYSATDTGLPPNMVAAMAEPVKGQYVGNQAEKVQKSTKKVNQTTKIKPPTQLGQLPGLPQVNYGLSNTEYQSKILGNP